MESFIYLREYSEQEKAELQTLIHSSTDKLPFTLAMPLTKLSHWVYKGDYGRAMNYALDFFEITVQYISCLLLRLMQEKEAGQPVKHEALIRVINKIDAKRPLSFGDWINDIFIPLLKGADKVMPDNPLVISLNKNMTYNGGHLLLGGKKEPSIVQIRNEYKGHSTTLSDDIYKGVIYTIEPRIFQMLKAIASLQDWLYFSCNKQLAPNQFRINLLNGNECNKEQTVETPHVLQPSHYYIQTSPAEIAVGEIVDLFPLIFDNEKNYIYVFQSLKEENIVYISSHEDAVTYIDDRWTDAFDKCMQQTVPAFDIAKELNWNEVLALTEQASRKFIENAYKEKKYNQELFVDRTKLSTFFHSFQQSDKNLFPLQGEAGQGKTNQLCYWTERLIEQGKGILIFNSSGFSEYTLEDKLKNTFGFSSRKAVQKLLDNIHKKASDNNEYIYFFFDAINECLMYKSVENDLEGPLSLYRNICLLLIKEEYPRFKVLFTCRSYTWKNLIQPHIQTEAQFIFHTEEEIAVRGFTDNELATAYKIYQELYQMDTAFAALQRTVAIRLKDPLMLKIACTNYLGTNLPPALCSYTSLALFEKMLQDISRSYAGKKQCQIVKGLANYILQEYEKGSPVDSIPESLLHQAYTNEQSPLYSMAQLVYKKNDISVAYGELLNKPERPILRLMEDETGEGRLQFIYERFLEFMLAMVFIERETSKLQHANETIPAEIFVKELHLSGINVVFMGAMRNAIIMNILRTNDLSILIRLVSEFGEDFEVMLLVTETINTLIHENYEKEVFALIDRLLDQQLPNGEKLIGQFNAVNTKIESNQANELIISEHNRLYEQLSPLIRLRKLASVSTVNGILLTDYFNESLYTENAFRLLWKLMTDPVKDVQNDTCLYIYYLSKKTHTSDYSLLKENLTQQIVLEMYRIIKNTSIIRMLFAQQTRKRSVIFLETATRLSTLFIIDALMAQNESSSKQVEMQLNEIRAVLKHFTANFYLLKLMMPFFQIIMRRQITFQSVYVNNAVEYQTFWDENIIPSKSNQMDEWCRETLKEIMPFVFYYNRYYKNSLPKTERKDDSDFSKYHTKILSAYEKGDSFSYFALERILVIMGTCSWDYIRPIIFEFFTDKYRKNKWFDYSQMSILYVLYQVAVNTPAANEEIIEWYGRESSDWTRRCIGLFKAHNSHKANPTQLYKRNVMNWYCVVYCCRSGDNVIRKDDKRCVPVFYQLLDEAFSGNDKELLYHLIENISELVSDYGYILTALDLLKYIMIQIDSIEKVNVLDAILLERSGIYKENIIPLIGKVLSTTKNYFPVEVDHFIEKELVRLKFPGVAKYRAEILSYNPSGETLSDLFTHKFGNFLMWALLNEEEVDKFAYEAMSLSVDSSNCIQWFDKVVRSLFKTLFKVKL
ncbi:MAG: hypothetical protein LBS55_11715 [Prevotellaceae bacterium]|jgi:hypothetical protein|nr:hypothetical protein [Prevotellaceae bacterium]